MRNTFKYDIEDYIRSPEKQKELRERRAELVRMLEDPKTPKRIKKTLPGSIWFIDLHLLDK